MDEKKRRGPVIIEDAGEAPEPVTRRRPVYLDSGLEAAAHTPETAPPVPDAEERAALARALAAPARGTGLLGRLVWAAAGGFVSLVAGVMLWDFVTGLLERNAILGWIAAGLVGVLGAAALAFVIGELAALSRLARIDRLQDRAMKARESLDAAEARGLVDALMAFYAGRKDLSWARKGLEERRAEILDADALLDAAERALIEPLDMQALREIETASRQVALVTAMVPLALADIAAALVANVRMIRRIAAIYGGRSGSLGSWRLIRAVSTHLVATGALAIGDDTIGAVLGGGVMSRLSRRFGEGVVNAALTARVGLAAMEVCRPMPHRALPAPSVVGLLRRALAGVVSRARPEG